MRFGQSGDKTIIRTPGWAKVPLEDEDDGKTIWATIERKKANLSGRGRECEGDRKAH